MGEIVDLQRDPAVEYDGHALAVISRMAGVLFGTARVMQLTDSAETTRKGLQVVDDLSPHADLLNEHIDTIERYAEEILEALMEDEEGYFSTESTIKYMTVTSIVKKKKRTIRIQRFLIKKTDGKMAPDNDILALECRNGALACGLSEAADVPERVRKRARI